MEYGCLFYQILALSTHAKDMLNLFLRKLLSENSTLWVTGYIPNVATSSIHLLKLWRRDVIAHANLDKRFTFSETMFDIREAMRCLNLSSLLLSVL